MESSQSHQTMFFKMDKLIQAHPGCNGNFCHFRWHGEWQNHAKDIIQIQKSRNCVTYRRWEFTTLTFMSWITDKSGMWEVENTKEDKKKKGFA